MANLITGLGGPAGFGETVLDRNDDQSSGAVDITGVFAAGLDFYGTTYSTLWVNNNGSVTFDGPLGAFTPTTISEGTTPGIFAYWADVDTRGGALAEASPGGTSQGTNLVHYDLDPDAGRIVVTWDDVGYFSNRTDRMNAFQLVLTEASGGDFNIEFRYEEIDWTTGNASGGTGGLGGTPARAGYSSDTGVFFELPQSGDEAALRAFETTPGNTGQDGLWRFAVRGGTIDPDGPDGPDGPDPDGPGRDDCAPRDPTPPVPSGGPGVTRFGTAAAETLGGSAGDDTFFGSAGADRFVGGAGIDTVSYYYSTLVIVDLQIDALQTNDAAGDSFAGIERIVGSTQNDQLRGDASDNIFFGGAVSDRLYGRAGDDRLNGGTGVDALYGNLGRDTLTGGGDPAQMDRFIYFSARDSPACAFERDVITDFVSGVDRIEIWRIDANEGLAGNQAFDFVGTAGFTGTAGELRYGPEGARTLVQADLDGDGLADFEIELVGTMTLEAGDFLL